MLSKFLHLNWPFTLRHLICRLALSNGPFFVKKTEACYMSDLDFWLVWTPSGHLPKVPHLDQKSAEKEAQRLAKRCPKRQFYVLHPVYRVDGKKVNQNVHS